MNTPSSVFHPFAHSTELDQKLAKIKLLALDVDGVLTDGRIHWRGDGFARDFSVKDGYGVRMLMKLGVEVAIITAGGDQDVKERSKMLGLRHSYHSCFKKREAFEEILQKMNITADQAAYMGDDRLDIPVLEIAGFSATVPHSIPEIKEKVHYVTQNPGGWGAVREVGEAIARVQNLDVTLF